MWGMSIGSPTRSTWPGTRALPGASCQWGKDPLRPLAFRRESLSQVGVHRRGGGGLPASAPVFYPACGPVVSTHCAPKGPQESDRSGGSSSRRSHILDPHHGGNRIENPPKG